jgi:hypothetical protein
MDKSTKDMRQTMSTLEFRVDGGFIWYRNSYDKNDYKMVLDCDKDDIYQIFAQLQGYQKGKETTGSDLKQVRTWRYRSKLPVVLDFWRLSQTIQHFA